MKRAMQDVITIYRQNPSGFCTRLYTPEEKQRIIAYMESFEPFAISGLVNDCVTGESSMKDNLGFTDGVFCWSAQDIYHINKYSAAVRDEFLSEIINK